MDRIEDLHRIRDPRTCADLLLGAERTEARGVAQGRSWSWCAAWAASSSSSCNSHPLRAEARMQLAIDVLVTLLQIALFAFLLWGASLCLFDMKKKPSMSEH